MIVQILKNHKWAIFLAVMAGIIIASPQPYFRYDNQDVYQGIEVIGTGDERAWLSRVREAYDGHPAISNAYFKEGKDDPYIIQPLGSNIIALLGRLFSLDINNTILLARFLFPFLVSLLIYGFILLLTKTKLVALATSSFLMLGNCLFARQALFQVLAGQSPSANYVNYTRPVNPAMTHLFFFGFLFCFWLFLERKQWRWGIPSALLLGLSFYDFFYTWTFLYSFLGVLVLIFLIQKKWLEVKRIGLMLLGSLLIAIPYLFNFYQVITWPNYIEVGQRVGLVVTRAPFLSLLPVSLLIIFLLFFPRKWPKCYYFCLALVLAPFVVLNQQIITGKLLSIAHYHWYFHLPLAIIFLLLIFFFWVTKINWRVLKKTSAILIIVISIFTGIWVQNNSYAINEEKMISKQRYGPLMDWFLQNTEKEEVVFSDNETARLIVIYTPLNVFYHSSARYLLAATTERVENTLFLYYRLDGLGQDEAQELFFKDRAVISWMVYGIYYRDTADGYQNIPDELLLDLIQKYQESFAVSTSDFFKQMLDKYEVKYLVWDRKDYPLWQIDQYTFLEKVFEIGDFVIYQK